MKVPGITASPAPGEVTRPGALTQAEVARYARHLLLPELGVEGQERLKAGAVLIVGAGGLGSPAALYLAAAGVGRIGIVDLDVVETSNLQRQVLYGEKDVGRRKVEAARERLLDLNPHIQVETHDVALTSDNAVDIISGYDVVVDGTDNFRTRYLVNDACVIAGRPDVYGSIFRFEGQASVFGLPGGPCYRCLYPTPPPPERVPPCSEAGVLGALPGIVGSIQATETIKLLLGDGGDSLAGRLLLFDAWSMSFTTVPVAKDPNCPACGEGRNRSISSELGPSCSARSASPATPAVPEAHVLSPTALAARLESGEDLLLLDVREPPEVGIATIAGAQNIPLGELRRRVDELPQDRAIVLYCKSGVRSTRAWHQLREAGHEAVYHLRDGLLGWQQAVQPELVRY